MNFAEELEALALDGTLPWGDTGRLITLESVSILARKYRMHGWDVEARALDCGIHPVRYLRNQNTITLEQQASILRSSACLIGLGGLGGLILETLVRTGVGTIRAADADHFEESNLNRQSLSNMRKLNVPKAEAASHKVLSINTSVELRTSQQYMDDRNLGEFLAHCDIAIDALGGLSARPALKDAAAALNIPLVSGALAGNTGWIATIMPGQPSPAEFMLGDESAETRLGCPAPCVNTISSLMCSEIVRILSKKEPLLAGKMLLVDLETMTFEKVHL